jgi:hypothetical protein
MLIYALSLLGLVALCAGWMLFQLWLERQDPDKQGGYQPGCGACSRRECPGATPHSEVAMPRRGESYGRQD